jgi:hypothetical protein
LRNSKRRRRRRRNWAGVYRTALVAFYTKAYRIGITHGTLCISGQWTPIIIGREENIFFFSFMLEHERKKERKKEESKRQELPVGVIIQRVNGRLGPLATGNRPTHAIFSYIITSGCFFFWKKKNLSVVRQRQHVRHLFFFFL